MSKELSGQLGFESLASLPAGEEVFADLTSLAGRLSELSSGKVGVSDSCVIEEDTWQETVAPAFPFTVTYEALTHPPGGDTWTSLLVDSLVSRSALPDVVGGKTTPVTCGHQVFASWLKVEPDLLCLKTSPDSSPQSAICALTADQEPSLFSATTTDATSPETDTKDSPPPTGATPVKHLWMTAQLSLITTLEPYSASWPVRGSMRSGQCWVQKTWAPRIDASDSGSWPTPQTAESDCSETREWDEKGMTKTPGGWSYGMNLGTAVGKEERQRMHLTPSAADAFTLNMECEDKSGRGSLAQRTQIAERKQWRTPKANQDGESEKTLDMVEDGSAEMSLNRQVAGMYRRDWKNNPVEAPGGSTPQTYPTPAAGDGWTDKLARNTDGKIHAPSLSAFVKTPEENWATPRALAISSTREPGTGGPILGEQVGVGSLNPDWTEWLMGFPVGWTDPSLEFAWTCPSESTDCTRSAMPRCLSQWLLRGRTWLDKLGW